MPAPTDLNDRIALAKGWMWDTEVLYLLTKPPVPFRVKGMDESHEHERTRWINPEGEPAMRPNFVGTLEGIAGLLRKLNEQEAAVNYDWQLRWSALFQIWDFYGEDGTTGERLVQFRSTKEEGLGIAVGEAWLSVFGPISDLTDPEKSL